ncbi:dihydropteroate synthase [Sphingorhabdus lutea]|uniref:dihydropteroate synthase n=1 Tax=Sphingorhabdus lutea TaxID=1913578 RepID=A0A1L3JBM0_9SPHN|nr:dihydropteroate synthase [Sphingorhabdus lutea]APG62522.1 dihydropteroate synthase [Sphingorhabdus lutea]
MSVIYLKACGFVDHPQFHDGATRRLAGTMLWFSQVEIYYKDAEGAFHRNLINITEFEQYIKILPAELQPKAKVQMAHICTPRPPIKMGDRIINLDQPRVMGILNMTPDSFSDGGAVDDDIGLALQAAVDMTANGAAIIDVGGESTRPNAKLLWEGDEIKRVQPIIEKLSATGAAISIDSRKSAVMQAALGAGARMINDISALLYDDNSIDIARHNDVPVVLMHAPSQSSNPHKNDGYDNVLFDVFDWLEKRVDEVIAAGVPRERICIDPGLGFGKSLSDNLTIINNLALFHAIGCPILFGASRKRMIGALSNEAAADNRLGGSIYLAMKAVEQGAHILRVHDVAETIQSIHVWRGLRDAALTARAE